MKPTSTGTKSRVAIGRRLILAVIATCSAPMNRITCQLEDYAELRPPLISACDEACDTLAAIRAKLDRSGSIDDIASVIGKASLDSALSHDTVRNTYRKVLENLPEKLGSTLDQHVVAPVKKMLWPAGLCIFAISLVVYLNRNPSGIKSLFQSRPQWATVLMILLGLAATIAMTGCRTYDWQVRLQSRAESATLSREVSDAMYKAEVACKSDAEQEGNAQRQIKECDSKNPPPETIYPVRWREVSDCSRPVFRYGPRYGSDTLRAVVQEGVALDQVSNAISTARKSHRGDHVNLGTRAMRSRVGHALASESESSLFLAVASLSSIAVEINVTSLPGGKSGEHQQPTCKTHAPAPSDTSNQMLFVKLSPSIAERAVITKGNDSNADVAITFEKPGKGAENTWKEIATQLKKNKKLAHERETELDKSIEEDRNYAARREGDRDDSHRTGSSLVREFRDQDAERNRLEISCGRIAVLFPGVKELSSPFFLDVGTKIKVEIRNPRISDDPVRCHVVIGLQSSMDVDRDHPLFIHAMPADEVAEKLAHWKQAWDSAAAQRESIPYYPRCYEASIDVKLKLKGLARLFNQQMSYGRH